MLKPSAIEEFIEAINASPKLRREAQKALDGSKGPKRFVDLGKQNNYKFTEAKARAYFRSLLQAPASKAVADRKLKVIVGAKDATPAPRDAQLENAVVMLRTMNFTKTPAWTGFGFVRTLRSAKKSR